MSTEKQIKGDSLRRQLVWSENFAQRHDLELQDTTAFADIGVSAWKGLNRTKGRLGAFIELVRDGTIPSSSYLLIENLDRLSRTTPLEALDLFKEILKLGITVVARGEYGEEEIYTWTSINSNSNQLISTLSSMLRANRESERKSQIIREAFENKRALSRKGVKTNQRPPHWITATKIAKGEFEYSLNDRAPLVQWIFERSADGVGFDKIARDLNARGEATLKPSKQGWFHTSVANIITNRSAIGEYQPYEEVDGTRIARGDPIADYYPPVVTNDLWLRAQKLPHRNRKGGRAGTRFSNLLDGLTSCTHCQSRMYMLCNSRSSKQWQYLVCSGNFRKLTKEVEVEGVKQTVPICTDGTARFRYDLVEQFILDNVMEFGISDHMRIKKADAELKAVDEAIADLSVKLESLRSREQRLLTLVETENDDEIPGLLTALKSRTKERKEAEEQLTTLTHDRDVTMAKQKALDPASAIEVMREQWEASEDDGIRYGLRVRTNTAMREVIDFITFDSIEQTYTVILFGGLRAYKFPNVKFVKGPIKVTPMVVDLTRFAAEMPSHFDIHRADQAGKIPLDPKRRLVNDMLVRKRMKSAS